jgi:hypothetical protein
MYNLNTHYENLFALVSNIITDPVMIYLHPFGSTSIENFEAFNHTGTGPIVFCYDQEPFVENFNEKLFLELRNKWRGTNPLRPIIVLNSERNSEIKNYYFTRYGLKDCYYFFHAFAAADWYRGQQYNKNIIPVRERKLDKKFIMLNRITSNARIYRALLVADLIKSSIVNQGYVSFSNVCPDNQQHYRDNLLESKLPTDLVKSTTALLDSLSNELRIDFVNDKIPNQSMLLSPLPAMMSSFVNVVTETEFWQTKQHLTEKIFKPIVARQPFILAGCANNLAYLKDYGFKTFDAWWDESYDSIEDPVARVHAISKLLETICSKSLDELTAMLHDMEEVLDYNYNHFYSKEFLDLCWSELATNLNAV